MKKKIAYILTAAAVFVNASSMTASAAYNSMREALEQIVNVECTGVTSIVGDNFIWLENTESGFSDTVTTYGIYDFASGQMAVDFQDYGKVDLNEIYYGGDGVFTLRGDDTDYLVDAITGETIPLDIQINRSDLKYYNGLSVVRAYFEESCELILLDEEGNYDVLPEVGQWCLENVSTWSLNVSRKQYTDAEHVLFRFAPEFMVYDITNNEIHGFENEEYEMKINSFLNCDVGVAVSGDYVVFMNMKGEDKNYYYAVTTLDGEDYIMPTVCDYSEMTETGNLLVVTDGVTQEIQLADKTINEAQPIGNFARVVRADEDRIVQDADIDAKWNPCFNVIRYKHQFFLDNVPSYYSGDTWYLGGNYQTISGTLYFPDDGNKDGTTNVRLIGDDKIIYESGEINAQNCSEGFSADVTGVQTLRIEYTGASYDLNGIMLGLSDTVLFPAEV